MEKQYIEQELKALAYDTLSEIERLQKQLQVINQKLYEIQNKPDGGESQEKTEDVKSKKTD